MCQHQVIFGACGHIIRSFVEKRCERKILSERTVGNQYFGLHLLTTRTVHERTYCSHCGPAPTMNKLKMRR